MVSITAILFASTNKPDVDCDNTETALLYRVTFNGLYTARKLLWMTDSQNGKTTELIWAHQKPFTATKAHCYRYALMEKSIDSLQSYIRSLDSPCHCAVNIKASSLQPIVSQSNGAAVVPLFHIIHSSRIFAVDRFEKNENNTSSSNRRCVFYESLKRRLLKHSRPR